MTMSGNSPVIGVFTEQSDAADAVNALNRAGFDNGQITFIAPGTVSSNFFSGIKSFFKEGTTNTSVADELQKIGISDQEADYCQKQYDSGRTILIVQAAGRSDQALGIMRENGGYNAATGPAA